MNDQVIFNVVLIASMLASTVIRWPHARRNRRNQVTGHLRDGLEKTLMGAVFIGMMILPLAWIATSQPAFANYARPAWLGWTGATLLLPCLWLLWRSHAELGRNWSPWLEVHAAQTLVTHGVYARIRHPMYGSIFISCIAQALLLPNWVTGPAGLVSFLAMYLERARREEDLMLHRFGTAYREYMGRTGRIMPR